ncbi:MAG TPA: hypothetical protein VLT86_16740 [Vicinamibacterales bacterium]|nr:hypothetical protein [Vicinamibacterales bacterium]
MARTRSLLDRFDEFCDTWYDKLVANVDSNDRKTVPPVTYKWWFVANRVTTGMVITDQERAIVIAPIEWNRFIGMTLDVLLAQVGANAVSIPGPHPETRK